MKANALVALGVAVALTLAGCGDDTSEPTTTTQSSGDTPGSDGTSAPPWPAPTEDVADVPIPPNIGVDPTNGAMSAVHTHEGDGTIHIEADAVGEEFTLGQLFLEWGVKLTLTQVGGVLAQEGQEVTLTSNGEPVTGDPMDLRLEPEQQIVLALG